MPSTRNLQKSGYNPIMTAAIKIAGTYAGAWSFRKNFASLFERQQDTFGLINGLRFMSFLWILVFHNFFAYGIFAGKEQLLTLSDSISPALWWIFNADKAVDMFFVISGFLISLILFKEISRTHDIRLGRFYFRRYLRLTPIYALLLFIYWVSGGRNHEYVWANFFYVNNFLSIDKMPLQWTWTLAVEEQFYLLLPLILLGVARMRSRPFMPVLCGLLALSFLIRLGVFYFLPDMWDSDYRAMLTDKALYPTFYENIYDNLVTRYGPFVCGAMAAWAYCFHFDNLQQWLQRHNRLRLALNLSAIALMIFFAGLPVFNQWLPASSWWLRGYLVANRNLFAAGLAWFMLVAFLRVHHMDWLNRVLSWRLWQPFSQLTYSMYLVHMIVILMVMFQANHYFSHQEFADESSRIAATLITGIGLSLLITLIIGVLCWVLVEKPFLNLRDAARTSQGATHTGPIRHSLPND